jgi:ribonuclease VapC
MIVDTSAIIAILRAEDEQLQFLESLSMAKGSISLSAPNLVETGFVAKAAKDPKIMAQLKELIENFGIRIAPFTEEMAWQAIEAHRIYGKGSGSKAKLNYGDCFAYALAKDMGEPLLYKGTDFGLTDIESVLSRL